MRRSRRNRQQNVLPNYKERRGEVYYNILEIGFQQCDCRALTNSALQAMKAICDEAAGTDSRMYYQNTKKEGWRYIRTSESGKKFQVKRSYGKHTNAIVPYLNWMKENAP